MAKRKSRPSHRYVQDAIANRFAIVCGNLSNNTVCNGLGVSRESIRRYRMGLALIPASIVAMLCDQYKVSPAWFLLGKGSTPRPSRPAPSKRSAAAREARMAPKRKGRRR